MTWDVVAQLREQAAAPSLAGDDVRIATINSCADLVERWRVLLITDLERLADESAFRSMGAVVKDSAEGRVYREVAKRLSATASQPT